jgi:hypothetical protein
MRTLVARRHIPVLAVTRPAVTRLEQVRRGAILQGLGNPAVAIPPVFAAHIAFAQFGEKE